MSKIKGVYMHCRQCIEADREVRYEICCNNKYVQVWCQNCDIEVVTLEVVAPSTEGNSTGRRNPPPMGTTEGERS